MGNKKRSLIARLAPFVIIFAAGAGFGYYVSDQRQDERVQEALEQAGSDLVERGRQIGESARDSAQAALRRLGGDST